MNNILQLRGNFQHQSNRSKPGASSLPVDGSVTAEHLQDMKQQLIEILNYWQKDKTINGALISVYYKYVVAKSNRIKGLLRVGSDDPNDAIRGSKFFGDNHIQHVFTYYTKLDAIQESIRRLDICCDIVASAYGDEITWKDIKSINEQPRYYNHAGLAKTNFVNVIVDAYHVQKFAIDRAEEPAEELSIITLFKTDIRTTELLGNLGITMIEAKVIDETTVRLDPNELQILLQKAPYLIAMKTNDLSDIPPEERRDCDASVLQIPSPKQEPTIGVIDTLFYEDVYFKEWVSYTRMVDENIETTTQDYNHGTEVTSIIVDGPSINPNMDDGCGRFRVKHFGIATGGRFSAFTALKAIREVVAMNRDIKVWNLSLGSALEIHQNFISPEAAELDKLQCMYDIVFVIAGTNKPTHVSGKMMIGAPADSLNSIVVNSVDFRGNAVSYHRVGPVLSFFHKPDVSYYGGDDNQKIRVCSPLGESLVKGTSFAAPWIARKMAYLIHTMGFSREVAKALLIDSAAGWDRQDDFSHSVGYGVVPQRIEDILQTNDDEIRFIMTGSSDAYETYTYNLPIPLDKEKHPFFARATLCYFPRCSRQQGVDYTSTEMDIHFGRIKDTKGKAAIQSINENKQGDTGFILIREDSARRLYRKWDNVKLISDTIKSQSRPRKSYISSGFNGLWGLSIKTKERLRSKNGQGLQFGVVVTLKEMHGKNRINDFIKLCMLRGWIVNEVDIINRLDLYAKAEEEVLF